MEHNTSTVPMQGMITSADEAEPARTLRCLINDPATAENIYQWLVGSGWFEQSQHGRTFRAHEALDRQQAALDNARAVLDNIDNRYAAAGPGNADFHHNRTYTDSQSDYQSRVEFDPRAPHSPSASTDVLSEIEVQQENNAPQRYAARDRYDDYERDQPPCSTTSSSRQLEPFVSEPIVRRSGQASHVSSRNDVSYENNVSNTQTSRAYIQPAAQYYTGKRSAFPQEGRRYGSREQSPYSRTQQVDYVESGHHQESSHTYPAASDSYNQHRCSSVATTLASTNTNYRPRHDNYDEYEPAPHPHDGRRNGRSRSPERHHISAREIYGSYRERDPRYSPVPVSAPVPASYTPVTTEAVANAGRDHTSNTAAQHDGANRATAAATTAGKQAGPNQPQDRDPQQERENLMAPLSFNAGQPGETRFFVLRSYNYANIYQAQKSGIWATQKINEDVFADAFRVCANVVFFFGVNTGPFYGYAKMRSLPSVSTPQPTWYRNLKMPATDPFEIEWLSTAPCERHHVGHLRNTLNDDLPVTRSRDGQEISEAAGLEMIRIMSREARKMMNGGVFGTA